jgi:Protein of unknown function (DUF2721)
MGFLQQRYDATVARYRAAISEHRSSEQEPARRDNLREQVIVFKRRCELMGYAYFSGLASAIVFILTLFAGGLDVVIPKTTILAIFGACAAFAGFALVITATVLVILDETYVHRQLDAELLDVPDLAHKTGQDAGRISRQQPRDIASVRE